MAGFLNPLSSAKTPLKEMAVASARSAPVRARGVEGEAMAVSVW